jgi:hypothetical protein
MTKEASVSSRCFVGLRNPSLLRFHKRRVEDGRPPRRPRKRTGYLHRLRPCSRLINLVQVNWTGPFHETSMTICGRRSNRVVAAFRNRVVAASTCCYGMRGGVFVNSTS